MLRIAGRPEERAVPRVFPELAGAFFLAVSFFGACFFGARFFALIFLPEVGLDFIAFLPFFLLAILAVYHLCSGCGSHCGQQPSGALPNGKMDGPPAYVRAATQMPKALRAV
ncbi:MAG: hypothetical protein ACLQBK_06270 [Candidatus Sulfotelmatobacter sp.]